MDAALALIRRIVVVMCENRSFDHLLGRLPLARIDGVPGPPPTNTWQTPTGSRTAAATAGAPAAMPFDPGHEFLDVHEQLYGTRDLTQPLPAVAPMSGFAASAERAAALAGTPGAGGLVLQGFAPEAVPVITALALQGAVCNYWFAPLPGPTWPNRFFVHAGTSGGLTQSPDDLEILGAYRFPQGTIYDRLVEVGKEWRIYHDGMPQSAGIESLRWSYLDPFTTRFRTLDHFAADVRADLLPDYTFIEPAYDTGGGFARGNSMHPLNPIACGELLLKQIYEALFAPEAPTARDTMLVITCDEHGGFHDHVPPPPAPPTGLDTGFQNPTHFGFDRYGVRVPGIVVSPFTDAGTVIGQDPADPATRFDHTSILATLRLRFGLRPLGARDAQASSLAQALTRSTPRTDLPPTLPDPGAPASCTRSIA